jgi:hypothetical protein
MISSMKLNQSNPYLKSAADWKATLRISAETSSAVEGIRAPFAKGREGKAPASKKAFIAHWKRRVEDEFSVYLSQRARRISIIGRVAGRILAQRAPF